MVAWIICMISLFGCSDESNGITSDTEDDEPSNVGYEILQIVSANEILVWLCRELTREEFDAIELPQGWFKNQPRESDPDAGSFARSPGASTDGYFTDKEHFGYLWRHNATVIESNTTVDDQGLLRLNRISKFHTVTFFAGRTLKVLVSPQGDQYVRITRDSDRLTDEPTLPSDWKLVNYVTKEELTIQLPNPTDNIRADNEDSFQGPIPELNLSS
jgi:hypothetical protein